MAEQFSFLAVTGVEIILLQMPLPKEINNSCFKLKYSVEKFVCSNLPLYLTVQNMNNGNLLISPVS